MLKLNPNIEASQDRLTQALGLLPFWVRDFCFQYATVDQVGDETKDIVQFMEDQYGFGKLYKFGSKLKDGMLISEYEEDEDMEWLASYDTPVGLVWFFPYAIVALPRVEENDYFITRMD